MARCQTEQAQKNLGGHKRVAGSRLAVMRNYTKIVALESSIPLQIEGNSMVSRLRFW